MAWLTPVTDRGSDARCTYADMNRIAGNINHLLGSSLPTTYGQDDDTTTTLVSVTAWSDILSALSSLCIAVGFSDPQPTDLMTFDNFNLVESLTLKVKERLDLIEKNANAVHYAGEGFYSSASPEIYSQGV